MDQPGEHQSTAKQGQLGESPITTNPTDDALVDVAPTTSGREWVGNILPLGTTATEPSPEVELAGANNLFIC